MNDQFLLQITLLNINRVIRIQTRLDMTLSSIVDALNQKYSTDNQGFFLSDASSYDNEDGTFFKIDLDHTVRDIMNRDIVAIPFNWL